MLKNDKIFGWVLVLLLGVVPVGLFLSSAFNSPEARLESFLKKVEATPEEAKAYRFAIHHPEILSKIPCFCGCGKQGHKSNKSCFIQEDPEKAKILPFDDHGLVCPMCVQIALGAENLHEQGVPVKEIRHRVDRVFESHHNLHPTATPRP